MQYDLVFEGGGAKGMVFVGAMEEFEGAGHTYGRLLGTSAGAITAALLAAGYSSQRMLEVLGEEEDGKPVFAGFMGVPGPFDKAMVEASATADFLRKIDIPILPDRIEEKVDTWLVNALLKVEKYRHLFSFVEEGGWFTASRFVDWMTEKLNTGPNGEHTGYGDMTLAQFFDARGVELGLVASDTTAQRILVLNHRTAPDCPLVWAVRMSMSIPLVWHEVDWREEWGKYRGEDMTDHVIVDGGMLSNFPIELLVSDQPQVTSVMGDKTSEHVLGFLIDETLPVEGAEQVATAEDEGGIAWGKLKTVSRLMALIDTMTKAHDKQVIEAFSNFVVRLPAEGYGTTEFGMSPERRDALVEAGRQAMKDHFFSEQMSRRRSRSRGPRPSAEEEAAVVADRIAARILGR